MEQYAHTAMTIVFIRSQQTIVYELCALIKLWYNLHFLD